MTSEDNWASVRGGGKTSSCFDVRLTDKICREHLQKCMLTLLENLNYDVLGDKGENDKCVSI